MGEVNFYLKKAEENGKSLIYLQYKYHGRKLVFSFGQKISPANWNKEKQRVKNNRETTADGKHSLNDLLDNLDKICLKGYHNEIKNGIPEITTIKKYLQEFINQNEEKAVEQPTLFNLIDRFIAGEIKHRGRDKSKNTLKNYAAVKQHLKAFEEKNKTKVTFDNVNLDFFYRYISFLQTLKNQSGNPLSQNTLAKDIRLIKVFLAEAVDLGLTENYQFKHKKFTVAEVDTDAVFLTEKQVIDLYNYDCKNKKLEQVKDLLVFGCFVGLRFSDYSTVKPENIVSDVNDSGELEYYIKIITQKTKELVIIPCNPIVLQIFEKYSANSNKLPRAFSNQKFNEYVKEVCKLAGLTEKGQLSSDPQKELWECISSHTARRSFATNFYLQGFPVIDLMKITGHKTEKAFLKYIRVSKLDAAKRLNLHMKKHWSERMIRVA